MSGEQQKETIFTFQNKKLQIAVEETSYHLRERNTHASTSVDEGKWKDV